MTETFAWEKQYTEPVLALCLFLAGFLACWLLQESRALKEYCSKRYPEEDTSLSITIAGKLLGMVLFGLLPLVLVQSFFRENITVYGLNFKNFPVTLGFLAIATAILIPVNWFAARKRENLERYPGIRAEIWTFRLVALNTMLWAGYLVAYEFMFRGLLLFSWAYAFGVWPAVAVNIALYSATHIPGGTREAAGAIPFGLVLCLVTLHTGNIWFAVLAHMVLALSNDYFSLYFHENMWFAARWK